jgi:membrane-bound metal-dependent hydrolase YbcI (DUF457 family)
MRWYSHAAIGLAIGAALAIYLALPLEAIILLSIISGVSALVPDIDHDSSKIRQVADFAAPLFALFYSISFKCPMLFCSIETWQQIAVSALAIVGGYAIIITYLKPRHRGIIHSFAAAVAYAIVLLLVSNMQFALFGLVGYLSHLLADGEIKLL